VFALLPLLQLLLLLMASCISTRESSMAVENDAGVMEADSSDV
jgi:hypothetical protein